MNLQKTHWTSKAATAFTVLFFVFCGLFLVDMRASSEVSRLGLASIAPENLESSPESFKLDLAVESRNFPVKDMVKTKAWADLQKRVSAYAERLKLLEGQGRRRTLWLSGLYLASTIGMAAFMFISRRRMPPCEPLKNSPNQRPSFEAQG